MNNDTHAFSFFNGFTGWPAEFKFFFNNDGRYYFGVLVVYDSPQAKKAKDQKKFIENLQKGDKIVTIAGIHGTINKVNEDNTLQLETNPGSYMKIEKSAISMEWTTQLNKPVR